MAAVGRGMILGAAVGALAGIYGSAFSSRRRREDEQRVRVAEYRAALHALREADAHRWREHVRVPAEAVATAFDQVAALLREQNALLRRQIETAEAGARFIGEKVEGRRPGIKAA